MTVTKFSTLVEASDDEHGTETPRASVDFEVVRDDAIQIWPSPRAPEPFRRTSENFVVYVPCALLWAFPRPLFERDGAEVIEEGDGALLIYTDMPFPIAQATYEG
jgi:hypothetical protein